MITSEYIFERGFLGPFFTIKDARTEEPKYKLRKSSFSLGYIFYRKNEGETEGEEIWRITKKGFFPSKFIIQNCLGYQDKKEAKASPEIGVFKMKGWINQTFNCNLRNEVALKWRIVKCFLGFTLTAEHHNCQDHENDQQQSSQDILAVLDIPLSLTSSKGTITLHWDLLLKQYPAFTQRIEELQTFILATALVSRWEWDRKQEESRKSNNAN